MPTVTAENRTAWQAVSTETAAQRPSVGTTVVITTGKFRGQQGHVTWHGPDAYASQQYHTDAMRLLGQLIGREGYRIRVQPAHGTAFFTKAAYADVQCTERL